MSKSRQTKKPSTPLYETPNDSRLPDLFFVLGIIILSFFACIALLNGKLISTHDKISPIIRLASVYHFFGDGQFLVRWVPDLRFGYGGPLFNFYPPFFYYLSCVLAFAGVDLIDAFNYTCILLWIGSGLTMYLYAKEFFGKYGAFIAAIAYVYVPYHIVDLYVRGAVAEFTAFPLFPLILWSFYKQARKPDLLYIVTGAVSLGLLLTSHNIMALIFTPVAFTYIFFLCATLPENRIKALFYNLASLVLAIALAAFFWLPAIIEKKYTHMSHMTSGYLSYQNHFVYLRQLFYSKWGYGPSVLGLEDAMSFQIGFVHIFMTIASIFLVGKFLKKSKTAGAHVIFFLAIGLITVFFTTALSSVLWKILPLIKFVQFPWRFLSIVALVVSFLSGSLFFIIENKTLKRIALPVVAVLIIATNVFYCKAGLYFKKTDNAVVEHLTARKNRKAPTGSRFFGDYTPVWVGAVPKTLAPQQLLIIQGDATVTDARHKATEHNFTVEADRLSVARFHTLFFPGWEVLVDGVRTDIDPVTSSGLMDFLVPKGEHHIQIKFNNTPLRSKATSVSLFSLLILAILMVVKLTTSQSAHLLRDTPQEPAQGMAHPKGLSAWLPPSCLFLISLAVYLKTLCPSVYGGNSGELISSAATLGISHPTGFPLYLLAGKLFAFLVPFGDMAFRFNIFSALFAALTVAVVYLILKELNSNTLAAFLGALTLAFSSTFWSHAVIAQTYAMTGFFIALCIYCLLLWRSRRKDKYLYLLSAALGLGLGTHPAILLIVPAAVALVAMTDVKTLRHPVALKSLALTALISVVLYLYIPLKAASGPVVDWGGPADLKSALKILFTSIKLFMLDFTPAGFAVILVGVSASWHRRRTILAALALIVIGNVALMAHYGNEETLLRLSLYLFPSYIVLSIWAGCGIDTIYSYIRARLKVAIVPSAILIIVPLACLITHYRLNDQSKNFSALDYGRNIFKTVPRGSVLLSDGNTTTGPLQYLQAATESEEGVIVIDRKRIALDSYCRHLIAYYPGAVPQDILSTPPEQRLARVIEANISKTPLYTTFLLSEIYDYIPYGLVYRIAPKGTPTDFAQIKKINNDLWNGYTKRGLLAPHDHKGAAEKNIVRKYAESRSGLGLYYSHSGHTDEARAAYEESIKIDPGHFSGLFHLGTLLTELGDKGKGADLLEKAMNADPDFFLRNTPVGGGIISEEMLKAEEHVQSANHYAALNNHKAAIEEFKQAIALKSDDPLLYILLGHAYINVNDMNGAFDAYQKAIALDTGIASAFAYLNLGAIYMNNKHDLPNAIVHFEKYIELVEENDYSVETRNKIEQIQSILRKLKDPVIRRDHPLFSN